jgi:hypothetical protein
MTMTAGIIKRNQSAAAEHRGAYEAMKPQTHNKHTGNKTKEHDTAKTLPEAKQVQKKHFHQRR